jgi:hypothetical protein
MSDGVFLLAASCEGDEGVFLLATVTPQSHRVYRDTDEIEEVDLPSRLERTLQLCTL